MARPKNEEIKSTVGEFKSEKVKAEETAKTFSEPKDVVKVVTVPEVKEVETEKPKDKKPGEYVEVHLMPPTVTLCLSKFGFTFNHLEKPILHKVEDKELIQELLDQKKFGIEVVIKDV